MCDVVLGAGQGSTQLALRLVEARHQVDPLVSARVHSGVLAALMSVVSHYEGIDYDAVGQCNISGVLNPKICHVIICIAHHFC